MLDGNEPMRTGNAPATADPVPGPVQPEPATDAAAAAPAHDDPSTASQRVVERDSPRDGEDRMSPADGPGVAETSTAATTAHGEPATTASQPGVTGHDDAAGRDRMPPANGLGFADTSTPPSTATSTAAPGDAGAARMALLAESDAGAYRSRWEAVQTGFVDEPRTAVKNADALVAEVMQHLASRFAEERTRLEAQWTSGEDAGTEDLRLALQRYRSFFQRLLER